MPRVSKTTSKKEVSVKKVSKIAAAKKTPIKRVRVSSVSPKKIPESVTFIKEPSTISANDPINAVTAQSSDKTVLIIGSIMLLLGLGLGYAGAQLTSTKPAPTVVAQQQQQAETQIIGQAAPDFTLTDTTGKSYTLSNYKGKKAVLLVIEATWCGYCKKEMPDLEAFYVANKDTLEVLSIANREDLATVKTWIESSGMKHPWLPDAQGVVGSKLSFQGTPHHVLIDKNGIIKHVRPGFATRAQLDAMLSLI